MVFPTDYFNICLSSFISFYSTAHGNVWDYRIPTMHLRKNNSLNSGWLCTESFAKAVARMLIKERIRRSVIESHMHLQNANTFYLNH